MFHGIHPIWSQHPFQNGWSFGWKAHLCMRGTVFWCDQGTPSRCGLHAKHDDDEQHEGIVPHHSSEVHWCFCPNLPRLWAQKPKEKETCWCIQTHCIRLFLRPLLTQFYWLSVRRIHRLMCVVSSSHGFWLSKTILSGLYILHQFQPRRPNVLQMKCISFSPCFRL